MRAIDAVIIFMILMVVLESLCNKNKRFGGVISLLYIALVYFISTKSKDTAWVILILPVIFMQLYFVAICFSSAHKD